MGLQLGMSVSDGPAIRHGKVFNPASWSSLGVRLVMLVSDGFPISHMLVSDEACRGLRWVSNQACQSPIVSDGSPIIIIFS